MSEHFLWWLDMFTFGQKMSNVQPLFQALRTYITIKFSYMYSTYAGYIITTNIMINYYCIQTSITNYHTFIMGKFPYEIYFIGILLWCIKQLRFHWKIFTILFKALKTTKVYLSEVFVVYSTHKLNLAHCTTYMYVATYVSDQVCENEPCSGIKMTDLFLSHVTYNLFVLIISTNVECNGK